MIGATFQPGADDQQRNSGHAKPSSGSGVQEAIRVLSLRLPKVTGANAAVPMPLLTSQGGGGNPRVDSIVQQVLSRIPQQPPQQAQAPSGPTFSGMGQPSSPWQPPSNFTPKVVIGNPPWWGTDADIRMPGQPGTPPGAIEPLPPNFQPPQPPSNPFPMPQQLLGSPTFPSGPAYPEDYRI